MIMDIFIRWSPAAVLLVLASSASRATCFLFRAASTLQATRLDCRRDLSYCQTSHRGHFLGTAPRTRRMGRAGFHLGMALASGDETVAARSSSKVVTGTPQLLVADGLSNTFDGTRFQFQDVQLIVCKGQKLGLVGVNGCGKSTLLEVLGKREACDAGTIESPKATVVTYVDQDPVFAEGSTVRDAIFAADNPLMRAVRDYQLAMESIEAAGPDADALERAMERFERATTAMDTVGGWDAETFANQVMSRLGVIGLQDEIIAKLSGGQLKRVALAAALIQKPDVLLLDEPTNHLDVDAIEWLEKLLAERSLTFVCVTHDRYFLENVCQEIIELDDAKLYRYPGNYERFLELKDERLSAEGAARESARNKMQGELAWMRKQPKARQAKSKARQERFFELKAKAAAPVGSKDKGLTLSSKTMRLGKTVVYLKDASLKFSSKILDDFAYEFDKGDRIGIVGGNGVGKTTFLNVLMGNQALDRGEVVTGETVRYGYYEQGGLADLNDDVRVMELVEDTCAAAEVLDTDVEPVAPSVQARRLLNLFQFPAARWNDRVGRLSGGEKRRLQLLKVLATSPNFLVLDEPTNDLDIISLQILEEFLLKDYKGCLVIVSHDRFFMDKVAKHLFSFEGDGVIRDFQGTFTEYIDYRRYNMKPRGSNSGSSEPTAERANAEDSVASAPPADQSYSSDKKRKMSNKEKFEFADLETAIDSLSERAKELERLLEGANEAGAGYTDMAEWTEELSRVEVEAEAKTDRWLELAELQ